MAFKGPIIKYEYKPNEFAHGVTIGGGQSAILAVVLVRVLTRITVDVTGSGITPMYQMISHSLSLPEDKTKWTLIFANVTEKDIRESGSFRS